MRIHSNVLTRADIFRAAELARVDVVDSSEHGSRKRARAFNVKLEGESRRRPNGGSSHNSGSGYVGSGYAATWDQWGVFLATLFEVDPEMVTPYYRDRFDFDERTGYRFEDGWPDDAHGDHTFRFSGIPRQQDCTKCSAVQRWS